MSRDNTRQMRQRPGPLLSWIPGQAPEQTLPATLAWATVAVAVALLFVVVAPTFGFACGALLVAAGLISWSQKRPELLLIGALGAAGLGNLGRLAAVGGAEITVYQGLFFAALIIYAWMIVAGREHIRRTPADLWLLLFLAAAFTAVPGAQEVKPSFAAFISLVSSVLLVFLVVGVATTAARLRTAMIAFLGIAACLGALAFLEHYHLFAVQAYYYTYVDGFRSRGTFEDPNVFGGILAAAVAMGIPLAATEKRLFRAVILWGAIGAAAIGVAMTLSRGAMLGLFVGSLFAVIFAPMKWVVRVSLVLAGVAAVLMLVFVVLSPAWIAAKITGIATNNSAQYRVFLADSAVRIFKAHPFGVGPGNFKEAITAYRNTRLPPGLLNSHTTYLTVLAEDGFMGLAGMIGALLVFLWVTMKTVLRARQTQVRTLAAAALAGFAVLAVQSMTYSLENSKFLWFLVGAGLAATALAHATNTEEAP